MTPLKVVKDAMKNRKHEKSVVAKIGGWWIRNMVARAKALHYGRAALLDERNGFPYTAAMEWRHAAEFLVSGSVASRVLRGAMGAHHALTPSSRRIVQQCSTCYFSALLRDLGFTEQPRSTYSNSIQIPRNTKEYL